MPVVLKERREPIDDNTIIWRYFDLAKFLDLLENQILFFCRADKFGDPLEGSLNRHWYNMEKRMEKQFQPFFKGTPRSATSEYSRQDFFISCWHKNDHENHAMWKIYGGSTNSIAIISTVKQLRDCISSYEILRDKFELDQVYYIDYEKDDFEILPVKDRNYSRFFHKHKIYKYEQEVRGVIELPEEIIHDNGIEVRNNGLCVSINIKDIVNKIIVSPESPTWFYKLINSIVSSRYKLAIKVTLSEVDKEPLFGSSGDT